MDSNMSSSKGSSIFQKYRYSFGILAVLCFFLFDLSTLAMVTSGIFALKYKQGSMFLKFWAVLTFKLFGLWFMLMQAVNCGILLAVLKWDSVQKSLSIMKDILKTFIEKEKSLDSKTGKTVKNVESVYDTTVNKLNSLINKFGLDKKVQLIEKYLNKVINLLLNLLQRIPYVGAQLDKGMTYLKSKTEETLENEDKVLHIKCNQKDASDDAQKDNQKDNQKDDLVEVKDELNDLKGMFNIPFPDLKYIKSGPSEDSMKNLQDLMKAMNQINSMMTTLDNVRKNQKK